MPIDVMLNANYIARKAHESIKGIKVRPKSMQGPILTRVGKLMNLQPFASFKGCRFIKCTYGKRIKIYSHCEALEGNKKKNCRMKFSLLASVGARTKVILK